MRTYLAVFAIIFSAGMGLSWQWGLDHRLSYLSRDYALLTGKFRLIDTYPVAGLAVFGDSIALDGIQPLRLGRNVINCAMDGSTPIESYFLIKRLVKAPARPKAVLLSYNAYHFVHPDFYWENTVKFGLISGAEADEVMNRIIRLKDPELLTGKGIWNLEQRLYSFLLSRGFPSYYLSSLWAEPFGVRRRENEEALKEIAQTRGQYYFPLSEGSKSLNADTQLRAFTVSPVVDYYLRETLQLLKHEKIPVYFFPMPVNESSVPHLDPGVIRGYRKYLESHAAGDPQFRILSKWPKVYSWRLFSDYAHLNEKGTLKLNQELSRTLNSSGVPGGPYGNLAQSPSSP